MDKKKKFMVIIVIIMAIISFVLAMIFKDINDFGLAAGFFMISTMMFYEKKKGWDPEKKLGGMNSSTVRYYERRKDFKGFQKEMKMWIVLFSGIATICLLSGFIKLIVKCIFT